MTLNLKPEISGYNCLYFFIVYPGHQYERMLAYKVCSQGTSVEVLCFIFNMCWGLCYWSVVCTSSVYSGHQSILIPPVELETNPALWLLAVSQLRVRDTFCSYSVMELCTKGLGLQTEALKVLPKYCTAVNTNTDRACLYRKPLLDQLEF